MAIGDPVQWIIIGVIVIVIFLWGPNKIPDLAKAIGRARREFDQASKQMNDVMTGNPLDAVTGMALAAQSSAPQKSGDQMLIETARSLGIYTEGKTREQISQEIINKSTPVPAPTTAPVPAVSEHQP
jgi:sec-independent protein translocase protein TatA